jgi:transcription initiation factor TFIIB
MQTAGGEEDGGHGKGPRPVAIIETMARLSVTGYAPVETASQVYLAVKDIRGYSQREVQAACVYAACRLFGIPRTLKDIASVCGVDATALASRYRMVVERVGLVMPVPEATEYVPGIASRAGLDPATERRAIEMLNLVKAAGTSAGKSPAGIAATALYEAYLELHPPENAGSTRRITQAQIAKAAGVTEVTLRNRSRTVRYALEAESARNDR